MGRFFIIGNGFDLHHNLPTSFSRFKNYVKEKSQKDFEQITSFFSDTCQIGADFFWSNIEDSLVNVTNFDMEDAFADVENSVETDIDKTSYWHDYQYISSCSFPLLDRLRVFFDEWVDGLDSGITNTKPDDRIHFTENDLFLNFNYTSTLQRLYGVSTKQILYLHGKIGDRKVFGHDLQPHLLGFRGDDFRIEEAIGILNCKQTQFFKNSEANIEKNKSFFDCIPQFHEVVFMGWSLGHQDEAYMRKILSLISDSMKITVVYLGSTTKKRFESFLENYGCKNRCVYIEWNEIDGFL